MSRTFVPMMLMLAPTVAMAGFDASSHRRPSRMGDTFEASSALDGDPTTAWSIDPEQDNAGQWIEVDVPTSTVDKLSVVVGWAKDEQTWIDYARVKTVRIQLFDMGSGEPKLVHESEATLEDKKERQEIELPNTRVGGDMLGGKVRLTVTGVYEGKDFANLAMGEMLVHLDEFDAATVSLDGTPSSETDDHDGSNLVDGSTKTFWSSKGEASDVSFTVDGGRYSLSSIGIVPGPKSHGRPKVMEISQSGVTKRYEMGEGSGPFWYELPALVGYTGSGIGPVTVKIVESTPGSTTKAVAVSEVKLKATVLDAF